MKRSSYVLCLAVSALALCGCEGEPAQPQQEEECSGADCMEADMGTPEDGDSDNDGVDDDTERACGSDPNDPNDAPRQSDGDGVCDGMDNCLTRDNADQADLDGDGMGDACDSDRDGDGANDDDEVTCGADPANAASFPVQSDGDGLCDRLDNCPEVDNADQLDLDQDGLGDACDDDQDGDGADDDDEVACGADPRDAASTVTDADDDGVCDALDNCPSVPNPDQADTNADGLGDACSANLDSDGDGVIDEIEQACGSDHLDAQSRPIDSDGDTLCDTIDNCPNLNIPQADLDGDGLGDGCDDDIDGDGADNLDEIDCGSLPFDPQSLPTDSDEDARCDALDNCPMLPNRGQLDLDGDGVGDGCDDDTDGDGAADDEERICGSNPRDAQSLPADLDTDGDGVCDALDNCAIEPNPGQEDLDGDTFGDLCDADIDNDGVPNGFEATCDSDPFDPNVANHDLDGDGLCSDIDNCPDRPNPDQANSDQGLCPNGVCASQFCQPLPGNDHYMLCFVPMGWHNARATCQREGADLLVLDSPQEEELLRASLQGFPPIWIGFSDLEQRGAYAWIDGEPLDQPRWLAPPEQLNPDPSMRCGVRQESGWLLADCAMNFPFVCEALPDEAGNPCDLCPGQIDDNSDRDGDGMGDACDACPDMPGPLNGGDIDGDGVGDACDRCIDVPDPLQGDADGDNIGDACDPDFVCTRDAQCGPSQTCLEGACQPISFTCPGGDYLDPNESRETAALVAQGHYGGLHACAGDADFYAIDLCDGGLLRAELHFPPILNETPFFDPFVTFGFQFRATSGFNHQHSHVSWAADAGTHVLEIRNEGDLPRVTLEVLYTGTQERPGDPYSLDLQITGCR